MQVACRVFLNDETQRVRGDDSVVAGRLGGPLEVTFPAIWLEAGRRHDGSGSDPPA
jgi:hypothetical protein